MNEDILHLSPNHISSSIQIRKKNNSYYSIQYYKGFEKKWVCGSFNKEQINDIINKINLDKNKNTDIFTILKKNLTQNIIKHFTYIEPIIQHDKKDIHINPYILGLWLGDGHSTTTTITSIDNIIIQKWYEYCNKLQLFMTVNGKIPRKTNILDGEKDFIASYYISGKHVKQNTFRKSLITYDLLNNKHIPKDYLYNDINTRLNLLAGIIDTDGSLDKNKYEIIQKNQKLSENIVELCKSLGFITQMVICNKSCIYKNEKKTNVYYRISISLNNTSLSIPVLLERKKWNQNNLDKLKYGTYIDIDGNILKKSSTIWTDDLKIKLYSIVKKYKVLEPNHPVPWLRFIDSCKDFHNISPRAMDSMYYKTLLREHDKYDKLYIDIEFNIIDNKWMNTYNEIFELFSNNINISQKTHKYLHNWYRNQLSNIDNTYNCKKDKLQLLKSMTPSTKNAL